MPYSSRRFFPGMTPIRHEVGSWKQPPLGPIAKPDRVVTNFPKQLVMYDIGPVHRIPAVWLQNLDPRHRRVWAKIRGQASRDPAYHLADRVAFARNIRVVCLLQQNGAGRRLGPGK